MSTPAAMANNTVYRCGEAYSASAQCPDGHAAEVIQPSAELHTHTSNPASVIRQEAREAQTLETKRLQAMQQATPTMPVGLGTPQQPTPSVTSSSTEYDRKHGKNERTGKPKSPYFTAKDPSTPTKKKSNAKALPTKP
ncbi:hypothetical protein [Limnohabitans sp.]|uniref:hypothetical protein n=1 Tax=Limnohabitans sp. TaxID=1907725 RepID=UPI00286F2808|nr:hypothetical protein [Limnohabitans sp.]